MDKFRKIFFRLWLEWWSLPLAILMFFVSPYIMHKISPEAGTFDFGMIQAFVFTAVGIVACNFLAWLGIRINFPSIFKFYATDFDKSFQGLTDRDKIIITLTLYILILLSTIILTSIIS